MKKPFHCSKCVTLKVTLPEGVAVSFCRITVRQLEALVRLSEALARLRCSDKITPTYVREVRAMWCQTCPRGPILLQTPTCFSAVWMGTCHTNLEQACFGVTTVSENFLIQFK